MKVLVTCEWSGVVSNAFRLLGLEAYSNDIVPGSSQAHHIIGDSLAVIRSQPWDLVIAHPPCTFLAKAGLHWNLNNPARQHNQLLAVQFVKDILNSDVHRIALENPMGALTKLFRPPNQIIYPWYFGEPYNKDICLWLKNLPPLQYDFNIQKPLKLKSTSNSVNSRMSQAEKSRIKSKFFHNVAMAMAEQWGTLSVDRPQLVPRLSQDPQSSNSPALVPRLSQDHAPLYPILFP